MASSRTCSSVIDPPSSSRARMSSDRRSSVAAPLRRRASMSPWPPPRIARVDQQSLAEHARKQPAGAVLVKAVRLLDQDLLDAPGIGDEVEVERQPRPDDGAVSAMDVRHPRQDVAPEQPAQV